MIGHNKQKCVRLHNAPLVVLQFNTSKIKTTIKKQHWLNPFESICGMHYYSIQ